MCPLNVNHHGFKSCNKQIKQNKRQKKLFAENTDKNCLCIPLLFVPIRSYFSSNQTRDTCFNHTVLLSTRHMDRKILSRFLTDSLNSLRLWPSFCFIYFTAVAYTMKDSLQKVLYISAKPDSGQTLQKPRLYQNWCYRYHKTAGKKCGFFLLFFFPLLHSPRDIPPFYF